MKIASLIAAGLLILASDLDQAQARVEKTLQYSKKQSFNAALRFLRVDRGYDIVEKDSDSGYLLFEYSADEDASSSNGSIEVIEREDETSLIVRLPQMPHHHETMLARALLKKLRADYGEPRKRKKVREKAAKPPPPPEDSEKPGSSPKAAPPPSSKQ